MAADVFLPRLVELGAVRSAAILAAVPLLGMAACSGVLLAGGAGEVAASAGACPPDGPDIVAAGAPPSPSSSAAASSSGVGRVPARVGIWKRPQLINAAHVIRAGKALGLDSWTVTVGVMTTMGESGLKILDHGDSAGPDSRGLWQQRANGAWGTLAERMDPHVSSTNAFKALTRVPGYRDLAPTIAAHRLQRNSNPNYYAPFWPDAVQVVAALTADPALLTALPAAGEGAAGTGCADIAQASTAKGAGAAAVSGKWANPLKPARYSLTSAFGQYRAFLPTSKLHKGQDLATSTGTPVRAVCDGVVVSAGWDGYGGGNQTVLDCGGGVTIKLMHQSAIGTKAGATVAAGQKVGAVGSTGNSTGPHLHEQIEIRGVPVDPVPFMRAKGVPL